MVVGRGDGVRVGQQDVGSTVVVGDRWMVGQGFGMVRLIRVIGHIVQGVAGWAGVEGRKRFVGWVAGFVGCRYAVGWGWWWWWGRMVFGRMVFCFYPKYSLKTATLVWCSISGWLVICWLGSMVDGCRGRMVVRFGRHHHRWWMVGWYWRMVFWFWWMVGRLGHVIF